MKPKSIKIRKTWGTMSPVSRIVPSKKGYKRIKKHFAEQFTFKDL